ncbi:MAG: lamin tail domain-containing protein [Ilumatobacter sp.]|nr:lamin tail domain-containing protein [Ilumatobacter sp.]
MLPLALSACPADDGSSGDEIGTTETDTDATDTTDADVDADTDVDVDTDTDTTDTTDTTETSPPDPFCGDGNVDPGEVCDDGNDDDTDDCTILCMPPACDDGIVSGAETDIDCGGPECEAKCDADQGCFQNEDCASLNCDPDNNVCFAAACDDGILNGTEEQVDCGGDTCDPCPDPAVVINEIDYDQPGGDTGEFVEIFNGTPDDLDLMGLFLVMINGSNNTVYGAVDLSNAGPTLVAGGYLVVGVPAITGGVPDDVLTIDQANNFLQNGSPDAVALVDVVNMEVIDNVAYEGPMGDVMFMGIDIVFTEAQPIDNDDGSLQRIPNGFDNDQPGDWLFINPPTPGLENIAP